MEKLKKLRDKAELGVLTALDLRDAVVNALLGRGESFNKQVNIDFKEADLPVIEGICVIPMTQDGKYVLTTVPKEDLNLFKSEVVNKDYLPYPSDFFEIVYPDYYSAVTGRKNDAVGLSDKQVALKEISEEIMLDLDPERLVEEQVGEIEGFQSLGSEPLFNQDMSTQFQLLKESQKITGKFSSNKHRTRRLTKIIQEKFAKKEIQLLKVILNKVYTVVLTDEEIELVRQRIKLENRGIFLLEIKSEDHAAEIERMWDVRAFTREALLRVDALRYQR